MREAEGDVGIVAVHDHRHEQSIQRIPGGRVRTECGKGRQYSRSVLGDVEAIQLEAFLADADRGVGVHGLESALGAVGVLAQLSIEIIVDGQYELGGGGDAGRCFDLPRQPAIRLLDPDFPLARHTVKSDCASQQGWWT